MASMDRAAIEALLAGRHIMVLAANRDGNEPLVAPLWYEYRDGRFFALIGLNSGKARLVRRNPAVTLCVQDETMPYKAVLVRGRAELRPGRDLDLHRRIHVRYLGRDVGEVVAEKMLAAIPEESAATLVVTPTAWRAWDYADNSSAAAGGWIADADLR